MTDTEELGPTQQETYTPDPPAAQAGGDEPGAETATVKKARFAPLEAGAPPTGSGTMDLLMDVRLDLSVELGRAAVPVRDVLALGQGCIVELDKLAGEPVDILVNGKPVARGEVIVVDENFGVRVTELVQTNQPKVAA